MVNMRLSNITKKYGKIFAADGFNLDVEDGEYVTILGPTGAGKTTILKIIAGLIDQDSGEVYIGERCVDDLPPENREIALLTQGYSLFPHMNVWENTIFAPTVHGWNEKKIEVIGKEMLNMVRLMDRVDAYPRELSGGMKQRNALARALASNAKVLLLDEPLRALDARLRIDLRYELRRLVKDLGITTIHVTHDQEEALTISDKIVVMRKGKVEQVGNPYEIFERPTNIFVAHFVGEANFVEVVITKKSSDKMEMIDRSGRTIISKPQDFDVGKKVIVGIKTEHTAIEKGEKPGTNTFLGKIQRIMFLGKYVSIEVKLEEGKKLHVKIPTSIGTAFKENMLVTVIFAPDRLFIFDYPEKGLEKELEVE